MSAAVLGAVIYITSAIVFPLGYVFGVSWGRQMALEATSSQENAGRS